MNQQHEAKARQVVGGFILLFIGLATCFSIVFILINNLSGVKISVKSSGRSLLGTMADASIPKQLEMPMANPEEIPKQTVAQVSVDSVKKTLAAAVVKTTVKRKESSKVDSAVVLVKNFPHAKSPRRINKDTESEVLASIEGGIKRYQIAMERYGSIMERHCLSKGIDSDFGISILLVESQANPKALNKKSGARSLMQLMPKTGYALAQARGIKGSWEKIVDTLLYDPEIAIMLGTDHIKRSYDFYGNYVHTANAYEAGDVGAFYQYQNAGRSAVDVAYYRKVYGIYQYIKTIKGLPLDPTMKPARFPSGLDSSLILVSN